MEKYKDSFMSDVRTDPVVDQLEVDHIISNDIYGIIKGAHPRQGIAVLFRHIRDNGSLDNIRKMCEIFIDTGKHGYPKMVELGERMMKDLEC